MVGSILSQACIFRKRGRGTNAFPPCQSRTHPSLSGLACKLICLDARFSGIFSKAHTNAPCFGRRKRIGILSRLLFSMPKIQGAVQKAIVGAVTLRKQSSRCRRQVSFSWVGGGSFRTATQQIPEYIKGRRTPLSNKPGS